MSGGRPPEQPKGWQIVWLFPMFQYDKEERALTVYFQHAWGFMKLDPDKTSLAFIYKWILSLGFVQIRAWQEEGFFELYEKSKKDILV